MPRRALLRNRRARGRSSAPSAPGALANRLRTRIGRLLCDRAVCARPATALRGLVCVVVYLATVPSPVVAQTLEEALATAYVANPALRAARAELRAVNEQVPQELSNWRPVVSLDGSAGRQRTDSTGGGGTFDGFDGSDGNGDGAESSTPLEAALTITQPLYRGGRTIAGTRRAENEVRAQRARLTATEQDVLFQAVTAYMDVWRDQAVLQLNINNERVLQRQLEATNDRFEVGEVTRTDVAQAESRLSSATADRIQAEGNLTTSRAVFQEVVGYIPSILEAPPPLERLPATLEQTLVQARQANPAVVSATFTERAAQHQIRVVEGELLPTVNLTGQLIHQEDQFSPDTESDQAAILAQVTVPLYQAGVVSSRIREAKQVANQRRLEVANTRRDVDQFAISSWQALETSRAQIESFNSAVRATNIALEGVRQENLVGARTVLDVLDAEQEFLDARVNLVVAQRDEVVASYQVVSAIGRLTAADLQLPVDAYDPEADYQTVRDRWFGLGIPEEKPSLLPVSSAAAVPFGDDAGALIGKWTGLRLPEQKPALP